MYVSYHTTNVSLRVWTSVIFVLLLTPGNVLLYTSIKAEEIAMIDGVNFAVLRTTNARMAEAKFPYCRIQRKSIDPSFGSIYQDGRRAIYNISCSHLSQSRLQKIFRLWQSAHRRNTTINTENSAD
jgi:hypothetical protein